MHMAGARVFGRSVRSAALDHSGWQLCCQIAHRGSSAALSAFLPALPEPSKGRLDIAAYAPAHAPAFRIVSRAKSLKIRLGQIVLMAAIRSASTASWTGLCQAVYVRHDEPHKRHVLR